MAVFRSHRGLFTTALPSIRDVVQIHTPRPASVLADPPDQGRRRLVARRQDPGAQRATSLTPADTVRGQYDGYPTCGRRPGFDHGVLRRRPARLDSWRWAGVPILIRAGKTMPVTATEVNIRFHRAAARPLGVNDPAMTNALRFRIWPEPGSTSPSPGRSPAPAGSRNCRNSPSPRNPARTCAPTTGSSAPHWTGTGCRSPARRRASRMAVRRPGARDVVPVHQLSARQLGSEGGRHRCCPRATAGTTRPTDPTGSCSASRRPAGGPPPRRDRAMDPFEARGPAAEQPGQRPTRGPSRRERFSEQLWAGTVGFLADNRRVCRVQCNRTRRR